VECLTLKGQLSHLAPETACSYASCIRSSHKFLVFSGISALRYKYALLVLVVDACDPTSSPDCGLFVVTLWCGMHS
jgi:hypothetical protein